MIVMCCQVEVPATSRSLVQRSPVECGLSVFSETSTMERPTRTLEPRKVKILFILDIYDFLSKAGTVLAALEH
jgi:hypothetical protein